jgi:hypothetical protein
MTSALTPTCKATIPRVKDPLRAAETGDQLLPIRRQSAGDRGRACCGSGAFGAGEITGSAVGQLQHAHRSLRVRHGKHEHSCTSPICGHPNPTHRIH